jgi:Domain of unknown function (DUF6984)
VAQDSLWRPLAGWERGILDRLFECDFPGREDLRPQLDRLTCKPAEKYGDDYGSLELHVEGLGAPWGMGRPVAEGEYPDDDGVPICIVLHVRDGQLWELEIFKADGGKMSKQPRAELFEPRAMRR